VAAFWEIFDSVDAAPGDAAVRAASPTLTPSLAATSVNSPPR